MAFGGRTLDLTRWEPVRQQRSALPNKPQGGLWLSPACHDDDGKLTGTAWTEFCRSSDLHADQEVVLTPIAFTPGARIVKLTDRASYDSLAAKVGTVAPDDPLDQPHLDWARAAEHLDAVWLTEKGVDELADTQAPLNGWDFPSLVVLNPAIVQVSAPPVQVRLTRWSAPSTVTEQSVTPASTGAQAFTSRLREVAAEMEGKGWFVGG
ncbi:hypothetical protein ACFY4C_41735 [Actinomadura viridis]|uniref:hypothetical protein n=1 Tax=Actinomadura viridis TaxID=58110 RepID=UPI00368336BD